jgi:predicted membrane protein (TIGR00267 family)
VAVAGAPLSVVLVAGLASALAGMISMATGSYLGSKAARDVQRAEIQKEARELEMHPDEEFAELVVLYQMEGMTRGRARLMAEHIASNKDLMLRTMVEKELGLPSEDTGNPVKDGLTMGGSFILAALVPVAPYFFLDRWPAIAVSVVAALAGLFALGAWKGRLVKQSPIRQGLEILGIGAGAAALAFALGNGIPRLFT